MPHTPQTRLLPVLLLLLLTPAAAAAPPVRVVGDSSYRPNIFLDEAGEPAGFDVEALRLIEERTGRPFEIRLMPWPQALAQLRDGKADVLMGVNRTPEREREFAFSQPLLENRGVVYVPHDAFTIRSVKDLDGRRVGVQHAAASVDWLRTRHPSVRLREFDSAAAAFEALQRGELDAVVCHRIAGDFTLDHQGWRSAFKVVGDPLFRAPYCLAVRRGDTATLGPINTAIQRLEAEGRLKALRAAWFGQEYFIDFEFQRSPAFKTLHNLMLGFLAFAVVAVLVILFMRFRMSRARKRAAQADRYFQTLIAGSSDIILVADPDGRIRQVSPAAKTVLGYEPDEMKGRRMRDLLHPDDLPRFEEAVADLGRIGMAALEARVGTRSGGWRVLDAIGRDYTEDPLVSGVVINARDATDKRRRELVQRATYAISEAANAAQSLDELYASIHSVVAELMPADNFFIALYDAARRTLSYPYWIDAHDPVPAPESLGKGLTSYVIRHGTPLLADERTLGELFASGDAEKLGSPSVCWLGAPLRIDQRVVGALVIQSYTPGVRYDGDDMNMLTFVSGQVAMAIQRKRVEQALADEKELLSVIMRSIGEGVVAADPAGRIMLINATAEDLTGWRAAEALGRPLDDVVHAARERTRERIDGWPARILKSDRRADVPDQVLLTARDGGERIVSVGGAPMRDAHNRVVGLLLVLRDVTEKRRIEDNLANALRLESLGLMAGGIAHDFNNILTGIIGHISLTKLAVPQGSEAFQLMQEAEKASLRARELTNQLLTFAQGGAPVKETAALGELLRDSADFALRGSAVCCDFQLPADLWPVEVDISQMNQVVQNLVLNAVQAMPNGGRILISGENIITSGDEGLPLQPGRYVKISIADSGLGIPESNLARIFDPYFSTKETGRGLGLPTTYSIIRRHDGHISVASTVGQGTVFHVYLPAGTRRPVPAGAPLPPPRPSSGRILVMDDEGLVRSTAQKMLRRLGYDAACARDGHEALEMYRRSMEEDRRFDAVVMDLTVPGGMGGKEAVRFLRAMDPGARIIVSSGYSNDPIMSEHRKLGFADVIVKPYRLEDMGRVIARVIEPRQR
jgi:PAS domain S-box-containing protein